jgi:uncharacterized protein with ParB-like and HNH nuclease domain
MVESPITVESKGRFVTDICSLEKLGSSRYLIPTYQRPYVWQYAQITKLLADFWSAYTRGDEHYFIGTIMTSVQNNKEELIDGQQRFTTLWLIAVAFKSLGVNSDITGFLKAGKDLRFDFAIREKLKDYLTLLMEDKKLAFQKYPVEDIENDEYLIHIARAITTIQSIINSNSYKGHQTIKGFGNYIYRDVQFVKNTTPKGINLNKLFTTINNSGIQLEQTDILKANLLRHIKTDKLLYSRIWEACENMENYFERNVRKLFQESNWAVVSLDDFKQFDRSKFLFRQTVNVVNADDTYEFDPTNGGQSLRKILEEAEVEVVSEDAQLTSAKNGGDTGNVERCESILSFGQLLLHTFRVFLHQSESDDFRLPFHVKNLLSVFKALEGEGDEQEVREKRIKAFFECLWQVRYAFDRHVIKWVEKPGEKDRNLVLMNLNKDKDNHQLKYSQKEKNDLSMLQSVLYFTSNYNTQIWLSPLLKRIMEGEDPLTCLESIDNKLSLSIKEDKETTYLLMEKGASIPDKLVLADELNKSSYPKFKHYWFQKLEYVLWKNWEKRDDPKFKEYRITSRNSLEHVFPQKHEFGKTINEQTLHSFGNLALLNVSQNSSYSDQAVGKKKIDFFAKSVYDSLKLYFIYKNSDVENWGETHISFHQKDMINQLIAHYGNNH